jgi:hypothetical protein
MNDSAGKMLNVKVRPQCYESKAINVNEDLM